MPLYDYKCTNCGTVREVRHGFKESHDEPCSACGAPMSRVFSPAPIVFKGSGYYVTDSRKSNGASKPAASESKSETKSETPSSTTESKGSESAA